MNAIVTHLAQVEASLGTPQRPPPTPAPHVQLQFVHLMANISENRIESNFIVNSKEAISQQNIPHCHLPLAAWDLPPPHLMPPQLQSTSCLHNLEKFLCNDWRTTRGAMSQ